MGKVESVTTEKRLNRKLKEKHFPRASDIHTISKSYGQVLCPETVKLGLVGAPISKIVPASK